ncbi:DUF4097 family beta strand repeat-containing protein [Companilactobacillus halodurans]|uniref:DUF4097 domain-containing protein n=1 Tax=Companilactobacillus halodurans TaxID=2584183 RepID=A0A5P1A0V5_9LACO|nr:DUF4097 family beta strand repeat-containing protein [Companilactobacillus halodurans]MQS98478.1 DUF4097 domain-containing protein [Companilactobacillus halodurans]
MRKYFVTGFYLLIVGGILLLGGFLMGANRSVVWNHGFKVAQNVDETYPLEKFDNIYLDGRSANVNVRFGDRYKIHVDGDKSQAPTYKVKDGTLTVSANKQKNHIGVNVFGRESVTITIPMNKSLDNISINLADSNIHINDVTVSHLMKTAKDLDYDANLYLNDVTIKKLNKANFYNATFSTKNSKISDMTLSASDYSDFKADNTTFTRSNINLDESNLSLQESNLDSMNALINHGKVAISKSTLMNQNKFKLFNSGRFSGSSIMVDGMKLSTDRGIVRYFGKNYGNNYQNKIDSTNLLDVKAADKGLITIK